MEKDFKIEKRESTPDYHERILQIINETKERVRVVLHDTILDRAVHESKKMDSRGEEERYREVREDVCKSFGVPIDSNHVFIYNQEVSGVVKQRAVRVFCVLIDALSGEAFYGEGRTAHNFLLKGMARLMKGKEVTEDDVQEIMDKVSANHSEYIFFKGFLSDGEDFSGHLDDVARRSLETPILDKDGNVVETPKNWFLSGHNISSS